MRNLISVAILVCFAVNTVYCQSPTLEISHTTPRARMNVIKAAVGSDVLIDCSVENIDIRLHSVSWQKVWYDTKGSNTLPIAKDTRVEDNTKHGIEKPQRFTWRLKIKSIAVTDEGEYQCFVIVSTQNKVHTSIYIQVTQAPNIDEAHSSTDTTVRAGDKVILTCNATGRPTPTIIWSRGGNAVLPGGGVQRTQARLVILNVQSSARGYYTCRATNEMGTAIRKIVLYVKFAPEIQVDRPSVKQAPGYLIELKCNIYANPEPKLEEMSWIFRGQGIRNDDRHRINVYRGAYNQVSFELILTPRRAEDYGTYTCKAVNSEGEGTAFAQLERTNTPQKTKSGYVILGGATHTINAIGLLFCLLLGFVLGVRRR